MNKKTYKLPILPPQASLIDTHCHLDMDAYDEDFNDVLQRAQSSRVHHIITIGIDITSSQKAIDLATKHKNISATVGIHPHDVDSISKATYDTLEELVTNNKEQIVGYGEIGLDYVKKYSLAENQRHHFANQLALAKNLNLPVVIHDREAHEDTLRIIKASGENRSGGVMHCFSGDMELARAVLDLGFFISIPGVVTFKNAKSLQEVARNIPLERMLVETDGPFLSPHPLRGKRNEPVNVLYTADFIAQLRRISLEEVAKQTTINARKLFKLPVKEGGL